MYLLTFLFFLFSFRIYYHPSHLVSDAFITDAVGAVIMAFGFGALNMAAKPIKSVQGDDYPEGTGFFFLYDMILVPDTGGLIEKILVAAPRHLNWKGICAEHIEDCEELFPGVYLLTVGTFKKFTPALISIASNVPSCTVIEISNNSIIQVRFSLKNPTEKLVDSLISFPGCTLAVKFQYPTVGKQENPVELCLSVETKNLMALLRYSVAQKLVIHQIYDYYSY